MAAVAIGGEENGARLKAVMAECRTRSSGLARGSCWEEERG
uniref:Uncharacterized protein n=1 Tax=Arundo donax TaxID=35708 RepID=A0A0A9BD77_ARUDO